MMLRVKQVDGVRVYGCFMTIVFSGEKGIEGRVETFSPDCNRRVEVSEKKMGCFFPL